MRGGGCCPFKARYEKRGVCVCCPFKARYEKRGWGPALQARYKKRGRGRGCLAEEGALPYMKGGVATPKPPPPPPLDPPLGVNDWGVKYALAYITGSHICLGVNDWGVKI